MANDVDEEIKEEVDALFVVTTHLAEEVLDVLMPVAHAVPFVNLHCARRPQRPPPGCRGREVDRSSPSPTSGRPRPSEALPSAAPDADEEGVFPGRADDARNAGHISDGLVEENEAEGVAGEEPVVGLRLLGSLPEAGQALLLAVEALSREVPKDEGLQTRDVS